VSALLRERFHAKEIASLVAYAVHGWLPERCLCRRVRRPKVRLLLPLVQLDSGG
jgi:hypothetical protein